MNDPNRYSARIAAVKMSFLRISATRNELRIVESNSVLDDDPHAAGALDPLAGALGEAVCLDGQLDRQLAAAEDLHRDVALLGEARVPQLLEAHGRALREPLRQVVEVDVLRVRAERLERHRHLLVRAAQLAHPHVDRVLGALQAGAALGARPRAVALLAAAGRLPGARALAATDALARPAGALRRLEVVQAL